MRSSRSSATPPRSSGSDRAGSWLPALAALALALAAPALLPPDLGVALAKEATTTIVTRSGATYEGRIVRRTKKAIVIEVRRGSISAQITIPHDEIEDEGKRGGTSSEVVRLRKAAKEAAAVRDPVARGAALMKAAAALEGAGDPAEAAQVYLDAGQADRGLRDQAEVAAAQAYLAADELPNAEATLNQTLQRNPKHARARAVARDLKAALAKKAKTLLEPGLRAYMERKPHRALRLLLEACEKLPRRVLDEASVRTKREFGLSVAEVLVDCRLQAECRKCEGSGVLECPAASINASVRCRFGRRVRKTRSENVGGVRFDKWERCRRCDGRGHLRCRSCDGLGMHLSQPSDYEREELTKTLKKQITELEGRAGKLNDKAEKDEREAALRSVAATELVGVLGQLRAYSRALVKLDPRTGAITGGDLRRKGKMAGKRTATIMTALANALYVAGEKRYEDAVTTHKDSAVPLAVRAVRARQAWEIVNQARMFTLDALELDPSIKGTTRGDMKRRLALIDGFLARTWKTYLALQAVEQNTSKNLLRRLLEKGASALGGLGGMGDLGGEGDFVTPEATLGSGRGRGRTK